MIHLQTGLPDLLNAVASIANVLLTIFLILIYKDLRDQQNSQTDILRNQSQIQKDQVRVMEKQEKVMQAQHQPILQLQRKSVIENSGQEMFKFDLKNLGNSIVKHPSLRMDIYLLREQPSDEKELMFSSENGGAFVPIYEEFDEESNGMKTGLCEDTELSNRIVIPSNSDEKTAYARPKYAFTYGGEYRENDFIEMVEFLENIEHIAAKFQFVIDYNNVADTTYSEFVGSYVLEEGESMDLNSFIESDQYSAYPVLDDEEISRVPGPR